MRPLHILLPIARLHLIEAGKHIGQYFTCFAAHQAYIQDQMTYKEADALKEAIYAKLGPDFATIFDALKFDIEETNLCKPDYIAARDKWLDELQAELESNFKEQAK